MYILRDRKSKAAIDSFETLEEALYEYNCLMALQEGYDLEIVKE